MGYKQASRPRQPARLPRATPLSLALPQRPVSPPYASIMCVFGPFAHCRRYDMILQLPIGTPGRRSRYLCLVQSNRADVTRMAFPSLEHASQLSPVATLNSTNCVTQQASNGNIHRLARPDWLWVVGRFAAQRSTEAPFLQRRLEVCIPPHAVRLSDDGLCTAGICLT